MWGVILEEMVVWIVNTTIMALLLVAARVGRCCYLSGASLAQAHIRVVTTAAASISIQ